MEISHNIHQDEAKSDVWTLGSEMRSMRISRGLSLEDVTERLKIKASVLAALEEGQEDNLPGRIYTLGFIRAYAEFLGLDGSEAVARYKREHDISIQPVELNFPVPPPSSGLPKKWIMLAAVGAAVAIFAGWQTYDRSRQIDVETVAAPPGLRSAPPQTAQLSSPAAEGTSEGAVATVADKAPPAMAADSAAGDGGTDETAALAVPGGGDAAASSATAMTTAAAPAGDETPAGTATENAAATDAPADGGGVSAAAPAAGQAAEEKPVTAAISKPAPESAPAGPSAASAGVSAATASSVVASAVAAQSSASATGMPAGDAAGSAGGDVRAEPDPSAAPSAAAASVAVPPPALPERTPVNLAMVDPKAKGRVFGSEGGRIVIRARQESWVQVTSADRTLLTRVLRPGDEFRVPDTGGLRLDTGNAGGLEIWVDGERIPPLAPVGNALSGVELSPDKLLARR